MNRALIVSTVALTLLLGLLAGCSEDDTQQGDAPADTSMDAGADTPAQEEDTARDEPPEADAAPDVIEPTTHPLCDDLKLPTQAFDADGEGFLFGDVVGDFTVETLDGPWMLSSEWSGCESYVFINYFNDLRQGGQGAWLGDVLWDTDVGELITESADNTHYFFTSFEETVGEREARMMVMRDRVEAALEALVEDEDAREGWRRRMHYVTGRSTEMGGSAGAFMADYLMYMFTDEALVDLGDRGMAQPPLPFAFAIDRGQRWDPVGDLSVITGQPPALRMASYVGHFFNYKADVAEQVAAGAASTEVVTLLEGSVSERVFVQEATLPEEGAMAAFDTMELDITVTCPHRNPYACSEWDRIARVEVCLDAECAERMEIMRWITPYWRRGTRRWLVDASPFLGLLREGGAKTFRIEMGPDWERKTTRDVRIDLRLSDRGGPKAIEVERAFTGGTFDATYADAHPPYDFTVPEEATRGEVVVILSGHGQEGDANCAEWCNHRHIFWLGSHRVANLMDTGAGEGAGCARQARAGVPPGQFGNWAPSRAYWCPGLPVETQRYEITRNVERDGANSLSYDTFLQGGTPEGGSIVLSAYVVWYVD